MIFLNVKWEKWVESGEENQTENFGKESFSEILGVKYV